MSIADSGYRTRYPLAPVELASLLDASSAGEQIPELTRGGVQQLIELEAAALLGVQLHGRTEERIDHCNGYWARTLSTQVGDLALQIPELRGQLPVLDICPRYQALCAHYGLVASRNNRRVAHENGPET